MSFGKPIANLRDPKNAALQQLRTWGYDDGYNGRPAITANATYQQAWRRGREAREAVERGNDAA